jgi:hypothetical protein
VLKVLGALLLVGAAVVGGIGVLWALGASGGAEWDYCQRGSGCTSGEVLGVFLIVLAAVAGFVGFVLLRRERHGPRSG